MQKYNRPPLLVFFEDIFDLVDILYIIDYLASARPAKFVDVDHLDCSRTIKSSLVENKSKNNSSNDQNA
jgi:hypothetical protein